MCAALVLLATLPAAPRAAERPGVAPETLWACPATHPIKGYVSIETGRHVYYVPGDRFYEDANPERCYATEDEARRDGSRRAGEEPRMRDEPTAGRGRIHRTFRDVVTALPLTLALLAAAPPAPAADHAVTVGDPRPREGRPRLPAFDPRGPRERPPADERERPRPERCETRVVVVDGRARTCTSCADSAPVVICP